MRKNNGDVLFSWATPTHVITAGWTYNDGSKHQALDLRAPTGTPIVAAEDGVVKSIQNWDGKTKTGMQSYGNMILISHATYNNKSLETRYAHLDRICVKVGQKVSESEVIGYSGNTGNSFGAHLHFEVLLNGIKVNPLFWLDNAFSCANATVAKHLGSYVSVVREDFIKTFKIVISSVTEGDKNVIINKLKELNITDYVVS